MPDKTKPDGVSSKTPPLRVLILEDNPRDAKLTVSVLAGGWGGVQHEITDSADTFRERLEKSEYDVILADFNLRDWTALDALEILKHSGEDIPLIVVTGTLGDEAAVECIKQGAADFVLKDRTARLPAAIRRALEERRLRAENQRAFEAVSRLATIVESSEDAIISKTLDGIITSWNKGAEKLFGYSAGEVLGQPISVIVPPGRMEEEKQILASLRHGEIPRQFESNRVRKDGSLVDVSLSMFLLNGSQGGVAGMASIARDITERKRAEEALRQSERKYRQLHESMIDGFVRVDIEGRIIEANDAFCKIVGYGPEELLRLTYQHLTPEKWHDFEADIIEQQVLTRGYSEIYLKEYERRDGAIIPVELRNYLMLDEAGNPMGMWAIVRDITERKWAEEMMQEYEKVVEGSDEMIAVVDRDYCYLLANRAYLDHRGLKREEVVGASAAEVLGEEVFARVVKEKLDECFRGNVVRYEMKYGFPKLGDREILVSYLPIEGFHGVDRVACFLQDITERKRADKALAQSEERYRTLFENAPVGIYRTTPEGSVLAANPALIKMLGYSSFEELAARDLNTGGFEPQYPRSQFMELLEENGEITGLESRWSRRDGTILHVRENARAIQNESGTTLYYEGTVEDITERKAAEAEKTRLVTAIEQSEEAVVITNIAGAIEYVNPAFTRITGYTREEALGQNPRILKSDKQEAGFYQELWETILRGEHWRGEVINRRKDGSFYNELMAISAVRGPLGKVTHFIATKQDVTEHRVLEEQVRQAAKMEAVGRLAGGVAHDFNNLLTIMNGYTELLMEELASDPVVSAHLKEVFNAGERAASLTRQLLAFSRRQVLAPQVLDLNVVVANLEKMLRRLIGEDIELRAILSPSLGRVKADPGQIEQVIMNLVVNARDAMPSGGSITLETCNAELDETFARNHVTVMPGPHVMVAVSDTGVGMTPETKARIFEPFFTTKEKGKGTGLGLATVYGIVKQSGGTIWVYSELNRGTVFKVYLPAVSESPAVKEPAKKGKDSASGSETILVVEDEEGVRSMVRLALVSAGYKVLETDGGENALATCTEHRGTIHLLLTDVVMPQMSGPLVAEKVTALRPGIKVMYMSGYTDDAVLHHGVLSQGTAFIQKPFSALALRRKIREVLGGK